jgi:ribonuclease P protein component
MPMKLLRLQGRKTSEQVLRKGRVWKGKTLNVHWISGPPKREKESANRGLFVGTIASAKLHKSAVVRNRMRRRVREALRIIAKEMPEIDSAQLLLAPRSASLTAPFEDIQKDVRTFLTTLPPWPPKRVPSVSGTLS